MTILGDLGEAGAGISTIICSGGTVGISFCGISMGCSTSSVFPTREDALTSGLLPDGCPLVVLGGPCRYDLSIGVKNLFGKQTGLYLSGCNLLFGLAHLNQIV